MDAERWGEKKKDSGKVLLEEVDEPVGGWIMGVDLCGILELWLDLLCQLFAQFNSDKTQGEVVSLLVFYLSEMTF